MLLKRSTFCIKEPPVEVPGYRLDSDASRELPLGISEKFNIEIYQHNS